MKAQSADRLLPVFTVSSSQSKQRGVAALTVVMVLFFVMAMVAAYTSRNMVFEQRTSVNQLRSTQALEAAQAGIEWATALLNAGRINSACTETGATTGDSTFRERYLTVSASSGAITRKVRSVPTIPPTELLPTCVSNAGVWSCSCPVDGAPSVGRDRARRRRSTVRHVRLW